MCVGCAVPKAGGVPESLREGPFPGEGGPFPWAAGPPLGGTLRWTGVAGLRLDVGGSAVAFDPFVSRPGLLATLLLPPRPALKDVASRFAGLDAVFVGHTHYDHAMDLPAVLAASPGAVVHGSPTTGVLLARLGLADRFRPLRDGSRVTVGPFAVEAVAAEHGRVPVVRLVDRREMPSRGLPLTPFRYPRGAVLAFRVEVAGRALYVQGSAGLQDGPLARQAPVDALFACLAARHGTPGYLERLGERLRPGCLVPIHHDDLFRALRAPPRPVAGLDWSGFLADHAALSRTYGTRLWRPPLDVAVAI